MIRWYKACIRERYTGVIYRKKKFKTVEQAKEWAELNKSICEEVEDIECYYEITSNDDSFYYSKC